MIKKVKGTYDILPEEIAKWQDLETVVRNVSKIFNFKEIRTPIFEASELFHRSVGETSDIVKKETYDFIDRGKRSITLRPEGTAPVVRAAIENKLYAAPDLPQKLYYYGPMFRYERPQKGRFRQFYQFGAEAIGSNSPLVDAEMIAYAVTFLKALRINNVKVKINSLGDESSKANYKQALLDYLKPNIKDLCGDCQRRYEENPLRVLDCKVDKDSIVLKQAPKPYDYLTDEARYHFDQVLRTLEAMDIKYILDKNLVRGLDYYTHTVFELDSDLETLGAQATLGGGGRYNNLFSDLDGPEVPSVGFAFGIERLLLALEAVARIETKPAIHCFMITIGSDVMDSALKIVSDLRMGGLIVDYDFFNRNLKGQFKQADRLNAMFYLIYGDEEAKAGVIKVKNTKTQVQEDVLLDRLYNYILAALRAPQNSCNGDCASCDSDC